MYGSCNDIFQNAHSSSKKKKEQHKILSSSLHLAKVDSWLMSASKSESLFVYFKLAGH